jgi:hypothetical protein
MQVTIQLFTGQFWEQMRKEINDDVPQFPVTFTEDKVMMKSDDFLCHSKKLWHIQKTTCRTTGQKEV